MRVGVLIRGEAEELRWAKELGFRSVEWIRFEESPAGLEQTWEASADAVGAAAADFGIRISAIGALYRNPLDPKQTEWARGVFQRAIAAAKRLGIRSVAGFPGAVVELEYRERGGHWIYKPFENFLGQMLDFWEPLAREAEENGIRIAFEHCPQGAFHLPVMGYNLLAQPSMWERLFNEPRSRNLGIEWDASHLMCQFIDPVENIHRFGSKIFHVHAKDAFINRPLLERYGICHPGVAEHRFPGLGQANWPEIVHALIRAGYDSDLNVEGRHDPVFRDHRVEANHPLSGRQLEETGLRIARNTLERLVPGD